MNGLMVMLYCFVPLKHLTKVGTCNCTAALICVHTNSCVPNSETYFVGLVYNYLTIIKTEFVVLVLVDLHNYLLLPTKIKVS